MEALKKSLLCDGHKALSCLLLSLIQLCNFSHHTLHDYLSFLGYDWGWILGTGTELSPYVCEISKEDIYKISQEERGPGKTMSFPHQELECPNHKPHVHHSVAYIFGHVIRLRCGQS